MSAVQFPSINTLKVFEAVARLRSIKRAAEELSLTPSAVSFQIKALEEQLGVQLLQAAPSVVLTDRGNAYQAAVTQAFDAILFGVMGIKEGAATIPLKLRVADFYGHNVLLPYFEAFSREFPQIRIEVDWAPDLSSQFEGAFETGNYDGIVVWGAGHWERYDVYALSEARVSAVAAPTLLRHPLPLDDLSVLAEYDWVVNRQAPLAWDWWLNGVGYSGVKTKGQRLVADNLAAVFAAVIEGKGLAVNDRTLVKQFVDRGEMVYLTDKCLAGQAYFLVCRRNPEPKLAMLIFLDWLIARVSGDLPCLRALSWPGIKGNIMTAEGSP